MKKALLTITIFLFVIGTCFLTLPQVNAEDGTGTSSGSASSGTMGVDPQPLSGVFEDIEGISADYVIPADYAFTPKFITGVTTVETNYNGAETTTNPNDPDRTLYKVKSTDANKVYALYKNVGKYNGKIIDLKITLIKVIESSVPDSSECAIAFSTNKFDIYGYGQFSSKYFRLDFYDHDTGEILRDFKSNITFGDIDGPKKSEEDNDSKPFKFSSETMAFKGFEKLMVLSQYKSHFKLTQMAGDSQTIDFDPTTYCQYYAPYITPQPPACTQALPQDVDYLFVSGTCNYTTETEEGYCEVRDGNSTPKAGDIVTLSNGSAEIAWRSYRLFLGQPPVKIDTPAPMKSVDKGTVEKDGNIKYTAEQFVPNLDTAFYYNSFKIEDALPAEVKLSDTSDFTKSVSIVNNAGEDVVGKFNLSYNNNVLTATAKSAALAEESFYNNTYIITLNTKVVATKSATIKNKIKTTIDNSTKESNEVTTKLEITGTDQTINNVPNTLSNMQVMILIFGIALTVIGATIFIKNRRKENV